MSEVATRRAAMSTQPVPQASTLGQQIPMPTFASVRVEFADGSFREFHIHKPLRAEVDISMPPPLDLTADLGAIPPGIMPPVLPEVKVRMKAGLDRNHQVITMDTRTDDSAGTIGRMLGLLSEAFDLHRSGSTDDLWLGWERRTGAFLSGGPR